VVATCERGSTKRGDEMKNRDRKRTGGWRSIAVPGAVMAAVAACSGCLYTAVPAMAGPSTTYQQPADSQPAAQPSPVSQQPSNDQTNQNNQNKQQNGMPPNGAQPQGQGGTP